MAISRLFPSFALITISIGTVVGFSILGNHNNAFYIMRKPITTSVLMAQKRGRPRGPVRNIEVKPPMNEDITHEELRVTVPNTAPNPSGKNIKDEALGIMTKTDALAKAQELGGLDLILINENSDPPVAKIADYSKYRYEKEKKAKELKKNAKQSEVKEVKMSYKIDVHDYGVRVKNASKFIMQGNRVKCTVQFKGREVQHDKLGFELLGRIENDMTKICTMEGKPKRQGRFLSVILSPRPAVTKAVNDKKRRDEKEKKKNKRESKSKMKILGAEEPSVAVTVDTEEKNNNDIFAVDILDDDVADDLEDTDGDLKNLF